MGYSKKFIEEKFDEIVEFSELQDFMEVPVETSPVVWLQDLRFPLQQSLIRKY